MVWIDAVIPARSRKDHIAVAVNVNGVPRIVRGGAFPRVGGEIVSVGGELQNNGALAQAIACLLYTSGGTMR